MAHDPSPPPVRIAFRVTSPELRRRLASACEQAGISVPEGASDDADLIVTELSSERIGPSACAVPALAVLAWRRRGRAGDVRAVIPPGLDEAMLGTVISAVAGAIAMAPRDGVAPGVWAEDGTREDREIDGADLTAREREVLALLAEGASNKTIARALSISVRTAKFHVASITEKLGAGGRQEAVAIAIRSGLLML